MVAAVVTRVLADRKKSLGLLALLFLITGLSAAFGALKFSSNTFDSYNPTSNLPSFRPYETLINHLPRVLNEDVEVFYIQNVQGGSAVNSYTKSLCADLNTTISSAKNFDDIVFELEWYDRFVNTPLDSLAPDYLSIDKSAMIFVVRLNSSAEGIDDFITLLRTTSTKLQPEVALHNHSIIATGRLITQQVADASTGKGFATSDGAGLPLIGLIFWYEVGSIRLLLIPVAALACSLLTSWFAGYLIATQTSLAIPSYEPNIILFLCLALSIDYTFFLLTRLQEQRKVSNMVQSVEVMVGQSGSIVLVSGSILVVSWLALCFFTVYGLNAVGLCSAIAIFICMVYNLALAPAMLLGFEPFFSRAGFSVLDDLPCCLRFCCKKPTEATSKKVSRYRRIALFVTKVPGSIFIPAVVYGIFIAGCVQLLNFEFSLGSSVSFGSSPEATAFASVIRQFPSGVFASPFVLVASVYLAPQPSKSTVFTEDFFSEACELMQQISAIDGVSASSSVGIMLNVSGSSVECITAAQAIDWAKATSTSNEATTFRHRLPRLLDLPINQTTVLTFAPTFNIFDTRSRDLVGSARGLIDVINQRANAKGYGFGLTHPIVTEIDAEHFTLRRFPYVLVGTLLVVFALIAVRFRAAFVPFKLCLTIVVPILFVFGLAVVVFKDGGLDWLHFAPLGKTGGISWLVPCATVFLLIGLALDYDIFLFSRVYELRRSGYSNRDSIVRAVELTGPIISGAGIIMALAFVGMIVSSNQFLNQQGFIMILG
eukprot:c14256_g1_i2.p1 GENE.c14256_g1_i2~~c14256_g1_i2.p1  ORF type:complete len:780 (+),score=173.46 c14256_g1_i2:38-2341(+)